jgi:hypothetical protein
MMSNRIRVFAAAAVLVLMGATQARADEWQWVLEPYVWATGIGANVSPPGRPAIDKSLSFGDLIKSVDMTAQVHVEAQHGRNGLMFDVFNSELSKDSQVALAQFGGAPASLSSKAAMTIVDAGGIFNPTGDQRGLTLIYGSRMFIQRAHVDAQIQVAPATTMSERLDLNATKVDALAGARYTQPLFSRMSAIGRADVSAGGTRYTWSATTGVAYALNSRYTITAGYHWMDLKLSGGNLADTKLTLSGFGSGLRMSF